MGAEGRAAFGAGEFVLGLGEDGVDDGSAESLLLLAAGQSKDWRLHFGNEAGDWSTESSLLVAAGQSEDWPLHFGNGAGDWSAESSLLVAANQSEDWPLHLAA